MKTRTEMDGIEDLEDEVSRLRRALADKILDYRISEAALYLVCQHAGVAPEDVKKRIVGYHRVASCLYLS